MTVSPLLPDFKSDIGYWGEDYPATIANNWIPWNFILAAGESEGLYIATHQEKLKEKVMFQFELHPAYTDSFLTTSVNPAPGQELERVSLQVVQFFFLAPKTRKGPGHRTRSVFRRLACRSGYLQAVARNMVCTACFPRLGRGRGFLATGANQLL